MWSLLVYNLGVLITRAFPMPFVYRLAAVLAEFQYLLAGRLRRAVHANMSQVVGQPTSAVLVHTLARRVFRGFAYNIVDILRTPRMTVSAMQELMQVDGWEHVERAHATGRGVLLVSAHFGNWEWGSMMAAQRGLPVNAVALDHRTPQVTQFFDERRRRQGVHTLPVEGSVFAIIRALRRGEVVAIMADRDVAHQGKPARFFGRLADMPRAHVSIAVKTGALIVPAFMERVAGHRFHARILPPIDVSALSPGEDQGEALGERCLEMIEAEIGARPDQWLVFEPIWPAADGSLDAS